MKAIIIFGLLASAIAVPLEKVEHVPQVTLPTPPDPVKIHPTHVPSMVRHHEIGHHEDVPAGEDHHHAGVLSQHIAVAVVQVPGIVEEDGDKVPVSNVGPPIVSVDKDKVQKIQERLKEVMAQVETHIPHVISHQKEVAKQKEHHAQHTHSEVDSTDDLVGEMAQHVVADAAVVPVLEHTV